jgi:hypothetical protein
VDNTIGFTELDIGKKQVVRIGKRVTQDGKRK